ncbi:MAG: hypothetical protein HY951_02180 [Bacteroidia bacterium]|nr:hypothetical protein [Bacteroidia bacterium]
MKNKTIISIILIFILNIQISGVIAQDKFTVIKVTGNIVIQSTGSALGIGTAFGQNEDLLFKSTDSRAAVINPKRGRFLLTSNNVSEFKNSKSNFLPATGNISARAGSFILNINDLKNYFEGNYVIFDKIKIKINPAAFPMNDKKYFYIRYNYKNETINKKLGFNVDTLIINKDELLTIDGKQIPNPEITEMKLMYMEEGEKYVSTPICIFTPIFPDFEILKTEVKIILEQMKDKPYKDKVNEVSAYINDFYGKPEENNLKNWLKENFNITQ